MKRMQSARQRQERTGDDLVRNRSQIFKRSAAARLIGLPCLAAKVKVRQRTGPNEGSDELAQAAGLRLEAVFVEVGLFEHATAEPK